VPAGRPPKFKSAADFTALADAYFEKQKQSDLSLTITGLCLALGTTRDVLVDYANGSQDSRDPEFSNAIKRAKMIVENSYEQRLASNNPTGAIFALKNFGWTDRVQNELSGPGGKPIEAAITVNFVKSQNGESK